MNQDRLLSSHWLWKSTYAVKSWSLIISELHSCRKHWPSLLYLISLLLVISSSNNKDVRCSNVEVRRSRCGVANKNEANFTALGNTGLLCCILLSQWLLVETTQRVDVHGRGAVESMNAKIVRLWNKLTEMSWERLRQPYVVSWDDRRTDEDLSIKPRARKR